MNAPNASLDTPNLNSPSTSLNASSESKVPRNRVLVVGCGYLGVRVARLALTRGDQVWATTRRRERAAELAAEGISPLVVDWTDRRTMRDLPEVDGVLVAVSYDPRGGSDRETAIVGGLSNLLTAIGAGRAGNSARGNPVASRNAASGSGDSPRMCYISTTGVYHQADGRWVDESSPTHPRREGGQAHLRAEQRLHRAWPGGPWTILRLAGIYGPGRVPRVADVIAGRPLASSDRGHLNLIHVDDAAAAVGVVLGIGGERPMAGLGDPAGLRHLYVVADDRPVVRGEFYREVARQAGVDPPRFVASTESTAGNGSGSATGKGSGGPERVPPQQETSPRRGDTDKRVWNRRMKRDLLPRLRYPSYREGLADVLGRRLPNRSPNP